MNAIDALREIYPTLQNGHKDKLLAAVDEIKAVATEVEQLRAALTLPEAPASATAKFYSPGGADWLITTRAATMADLHNQIVDLESTLLEHGWTTGSGRLTPPSSPANGNSATGELFFTAQSLVVNIDSEKQKAYYKVKGGIFHKWGVPIWPEVLEEAGINTAEINPLQPPNIAGMTACYVTKDDGKPDKVVRLA